MPGQLTEEEQTEQDRLEAEEKAKADEEARKAAEAKEKEDRGDDFAPTDDEEKELDADALAKIAGEEEDPEAKKKAEEAAAAKKKEEDDAAAKKAAEEKEPGDVDEIDRKIKVPKWRLDQESHKRQEVERENALLRSQLEAAGKGQPAAPAKTEEKPKEEVKGYDFDDAEQRYADALIEGDKKKAAEIRSEIRTEEEKGRQAKQDEQNTATATRQAIENEAVAIVTRMFKEYPFFDSTNTQANKRAINTLIAVRDAAFREGMPFPKAVQHAFDEVGPAYAHLAEKPTVDKNKEKKTAEQLEADKKKLSDEEKKKAAEAAGAQPPDLKGGSQQAGKKINAATLTDAEFDALPEPEKARLRGDNT